MKLGFIGAGNMGGAILRGFINQKIIAAQDIYVIRKNKELLNKMAGDLGIVPCTDYKELIENCDIVFMAVKPVMFKEILNDISADLNKYKPLLVSMAAGLEISDIEKMADYTGAIIRIMPNINAEIAMSATAYCGNKACSQENLATIENLFSTIGLATAVAEGLFPVFTGIAGCSPAFVYMFIDGLARGAVKNGMNKKQALEISAQAVLGSAAMFLKSNQHPFELVDKVCSPGGTTIAGVCELQEYRFDSALVSAVDATIKKDKELRK